MGSILCSKNLIAISNPLNPITLFLKQEQHQQDEVLSKEARMARVHRVASELLSTEEQYVTVLYLIDQVCTQTLSSNVPLGLSLKFWR